MFNGSPGPTGIQNNSLGMWKIACQQRDGRPAGCIKPGVYR
jgi:hypothetical protein